MELNIECVRDILITLEQQSDFVAMPTHEFFKLLPQYPQKQILYTSWRLHEGGYINLFTFCPPGSSTPTIRLVGDLTFKGHEFLADIKPKNNWDRLSIIFKQGGTASLKTIANIAIDLGTDVLKSKLGLKD